MIHRLERLLACFILAAPILSYGAEWHSPAEQATLIELYTSEGCSSCPPADRWLAEFQSNPDLWKRLVPLGFHVDYWDHLGWHDRFARAEYSERQRRHEIAGNTNAVYTPGFVVNGAEWRGFFFGWGSAPLSTKRPGVLAVSSEGNEITVRFDPLTAGQGPWVANLVWLGFDLEDEISRGENRGKTLIHDFVVLEHYALSGPDRTWTFRASPPDEARAIAVWIAAPDTLVPVQATGGWL